VGASWNVTPHGGRNPGENRFTDILGAIQNPNFFLEGKGLPGFQKEFENLSFQGEFFYILGEGKVSLPKRGIRFRVKKGGRKKPNGAHGATLKRFGGFSRNIT